MKRAGKIYIGTSGWLYKHWKGNFYPAQLKAKEHFDHYLQYFKTVEINNSFYRLPEEEVFAKWKASTPEDFIYAVKASRFITHMKKLNVDEDVISDFFRRVIRLDEKLGPILFQLPPKWNINAERLESFLSKLPAGFRYTFEFRNHSWYAPEIYKLLKKFNAAFCIYELAGHMSPMEITADFIYVRLHGPGDKYQGSYPLNSLKKWANLCSGWSAGKKDVYIYFDNDQEGYAAFNAIGLGNLIKKDI